MIQSGRPLRDVDDKVQAIDFGSWWNRKPGDYTDSEYFAPQVKPIVFAL